MPTQQKTARVAELKERIQGANALLFADYRGLTVPEISELRGSLREVQASFAVVKNTLMQLATEQAGVKELQEFFSGPSAVAFINGDPVAAAKTIAAVAKRIPALDVKGGWMDGRMLSADEAKRLAELESREVMLSKIAGLAKGEMVRAASMFQAAQARFLALLEAYMEKLPVEGPDSGSTVVEGDVESTDEDPAVAAGDVAAEDDQSGQDEDGKE
jgi:large subunit ribosomal protein L10